MISPSATTASPAQTSSLRQRVLEDLVGSAVKLARDRYPTLAGRLAAALIDAPDGDSGAIQRSMRAGSLLRCGQAEFVHLAAQALEQALRREVAALSNSAPERRGECDQTVATLPAGNRAFESAPVAITRPFDLVHSDALQTLNVRLAFLLDRGILRMSENPFRPEVFLSALQHAWTAFAAGREGAPLLPLITPGSFMELGPILNALNLALQSQSTLFGSAGGHQRRRSDAPASAPR